MRPYGEALRSFRRLDSEARSVPRPRMDWVQGMKDGTGPGREPLPREVRSHNGAETSRELLERLRGGDRQAFEQLLQRYHLPLRRWASGRLPGWARSAIDTDDLVQDTLIQVFKKADTFQPRHDGALQAYLRQTLHNRILEELRRARRRPLAGEVQVEAIDPEPSPVEKVVGKEALERYESTLKQLRDEDREAIVMRLEMGCAYEDMARALGKPSANAARMAVTRAILRLAERIADEH